MSITQTVEVPADHRLTIDVPREIPAGLVVLTLAPIQGAKEQRYDTVPVPGAVTILSGKLYRRRRRKPLIQIVSLFRDFLENTKGFLAVMAWLTKELFVMSGINLVFDTCAVVKLLNRQYDLNSLGINIDEAQLLTSVIVRMELLSKRNITDDEESDIQEFLNDLVVVPLDEAIIQKAIEIRRATSAKLPDSIIAATSIILNAVLLTDDQHLLNLELPGFRAHNIF